ncbi:uncharacterized protein BO97DRAFT_448093 [Aspergillus homomorphus CBS 101889]|uniref:Rhodopsin domain-containing protein n=1 Tax=Aspergillus homomorphus (strain CBS 101889) TaxID=1450537 RepID=A0A395IHD8_ASPHC|nr:hypothetical protein BO97DRAFT_448093 [Aspergillus homomorphus CBS 101889]RAL17624.1 hypothetical protein BO97DRAFT_448093 [Aspergillus homomorphus CBS 101889]
MDLCAIPAASPPPGHTPNLIDPPSLAGTTVVVTTSLITWATLFIAARLYTRFGNLSSADCDSDFAAIALVLSAGYNGRVLAMLQYARHQWDIPACWFDATYMKILYAQGALMGPVIFFAKASILLLYQQIFPLEKPMKLAIRLGLVATFVIYWPHVALESYFCAPHVGETWTDLLITRRPEKMIFWGILQGTLAVMDLCILILPLPRLWTLQLSRPKRLQIMTLFSTAMLGVVASAMALAYRIGLKTSSDLTFIQSQLFICINVENNIAIIVSCVPSVAKFIRSDVVESSFFRSLRSMFRSSSRGYGSDANDGVEISGGIGKRPRSHVVEANDEYHELQGLVSEAR